MSLIHSPKNSFLLIQLITLLLLLTTSTKLHADDDRTPAEAPHSHHPQPRKLVAVRGMVYCKSCKYIGNDTVLGSNATPISGATVKLQCNNSNHPMTEQTITDKNGFFLIMPAQKVTTLGFHKCKVFLVSSPMTTCSVPTDFHGGVGGASLVATPLPPVGAGNETEEKYMMFTVGPFAFEPQKNVTCHT